MGDRTDDVLGEREDHPSYGKIVLNKTMSGGRGHAMVGSPLLHHSLVKLEVKGAVKRRQYGKDYFYDDKTIVDLYMTEHQWAEFVSSFGVGAGVPVTLNYRPAPGYELMRCEDPPHTSPRSAHVGDVDKALAKARAVVDELNAATTALKKPAAQVKRADLDRVADAALQVNNWLASNLPFVQQCFEEAMEKTVASAKAEVMGFTTGLLMQAGLEHLQSTAPTLAIDHDESANRG